MQNIMLIYYQDFLFWIYFISNYYRLWPFFFLGIFMSIVFVFCIHLRKYMHYISSLAEKIYIIIFFLLNELQLSSFGYNNKEHDYRSFFPHVVDEITKSKKKSYLYASKFDFSFPSISLSSCMLSETWKREHGSRNRWCLMMIAYRQ
jgi:hypothetical protein